MKEMGLSPGVRLAWQFGGDFALQENSLILPRHILLGIFSLEKLSNVPERDANANSLMTLAAPEIDQFRELSGRYGLNVSLLRRALRESPAGSEEKKSIPAQGQRVSRSAGTKQIFEAASHSSAESGSSQLDLISLLRSILEANDPEIEAAIGEQKLALLKLAGDLGIFSFDPRRFSLGLDSGLSDLDSLASDEALPLQITEAVDASVAVETQRLSDAMERMATLSELTWECGTRTQLDAMLQKALDVLLRTLGHGERGVILVRDSEDGELLLKACAPQGAAPMISMASARKAIADRKGFIWKRGEDLTLSQKESKVELGMYVPLVVNGQSIGVICIDCFSPHQIFQRDDLLLLTSFGHQLALAIANNELRTHLQENAELLQRLMTNFSPKVRAHLLHRAKMGRLRLGGEMSVVSVLCADIRGFVRLTAGMAADEVVALLNEYFAALTDCIFRNDGTIDKFVGDAILAVFGSPEEDPKHCWKAVSAAMDMQAAAQEVSQRRNKRGEIGCEIGIGIHTGEVLHGFIGSSERMEFTVIGETVNRASRYCDGAKGGEVLISPAIYQRTWNGIETQQVAIPTKHEGDMVAYRVDRVRGHGLPH
jgi:adenylate cyclase